MLHINVMHNHLVNHMGLGSFGRWMHLFVTVGARILGRNKTTEDDYRNNIETINEGDVQHDMDEDRSTRLEDKFNMEMMFY